jgi:outer membrane protein insertion porin family
MLMLSLRFRRFAIVTAGIVLCQLPAYGQDADPSSSTKLQGAKPCQYHTRDRQPSEGPEISISNVSFSGYLQMPVAEQNRIAASITQRTYSGSLDGVKGEAEERLRAEWMNRGYFKVQLNSDAHVLSSNAAGERLALSVHVDEGPRYRLVQITFRNNKAVANLKVLRALFPIEDGDIFSREKVAKGLENLRRAYGQLGYINFTSVPDTTFNDDNQTISLAVDLDEGKQFYVRSIDIVGADRALLKDLPLKPGQIYNVQLVERFLYKHLPGAVVHDPNIQKLALDERAGRVAITLDFRGCQAE